MTLIKFISTIFVEIDLPEELANEVVTLKGCGQRVLCNSVTEDIIIAIKNRINAQDRMKIKGKTILNNM